MSFLEQPSRYLFFTGKGAALREMPPRLRELPTMGVPLRAFNMVGLPALRALLDDRAAAALDRSAPPPRPAPPLPRLKSLIDEIARPGHRAGDGDGQGRRR